MRNILPILLVLLFTSCKVTQGMKNESNEEFSIDGEYRLVPLRYTGFELEDWFYIEGNDYIFYRWGPGYLPPIKGTITKLEDNNYLFNSEYQDSRLNYKKNKVGVASDSVVIDIRFLSGSDILDSDCLAILKNGETVPFPNSNPICLSCTFANQIMGFYNNHGSWDLSACVSKFEGGYQYNIILMDERYYVMKNEKIKIINDSLVWPFEFVEDSIVSIFEHVYIRKQHASQVE